MGRASMVVSAMMISYLNRGGVPNASPRPLVTGPADGQPAGRPVEARPEGPREEVLERV